MSKPTLKRLIRKSTLGALLLGTHISLLDPAVSEAIGRAGFDFAIVDAIDADCGDVGLSALRNHLKNLAMTGTPSLVRVTINEENHIARVLAPGPDGIIFPGINTAEDALRVLSMTLPPPEGTRKINPLLEVGGAAGRAGDHLCRIIQLDTAESLRNIEDLVKIKHIDGFFFSPGGLCGEDGDPGLLFGPDTYSLLSHAARILKKRKKPFGVSVARTGPRVLSFWFELGVGIAACGSDIGYILEGSVDNINQIRSGERSGY